MATDQSCRTQRSCAEPVHVVARNGAAVAFYDDVEEEFATGIADNRGNLSQQKLYGELRWALAGLNSHGSTGNSVGPAEPTI